MSSGRKRRIEMTLRVRIRRGIGRGIRIERSIRDHIRRKGLALKIQNLTLKTVIEDIKRVKESIQIVETKEDTKERNLATEEDVAHPTRTPLLQNHPKTTIKVIKLSSKSPVSKYNSLSNFKSAGSSC